MAKLLWLTIFTMQRRDKYTTCKNQQHIYLQFSIINTMNIKHIYFVFVFSSNPWSFLDTEENVSETRSFSLWIPINTASDSNSVISWLAPMKNEDSSKSWRRRRTFTPLWYSLQKKIKHCVRIFPKRNITWLITNYQSSHSPSLQFVVVGLKYHC